MKKNQVQIWRIFFIVILIMHFVVTGFSFQGLLSSAKAVQSSNALSTNSNKSDVVLQSIYSEVDYLLAGQNKNSTDRFAYGDFYRTWWEGGQWYDPEEARAQEPVYLLAWLYTHAGKYQNNQTILAALIKAIDRYCRWQLDGNSGRIGLTYATTAFMSSVLRAYRLIESVDLGNLTEFDSVLGDQDDVNSDYELYLSTSDRWTLGDGFRTAQVDNDYFVLYTTAPAQNRRVFSDPIGWLDNEADSYADFDFYVSVRYFENFTGNIPIKIASQANCDWNDCPVVANITGKSVQEWKWINFTVASDMLWIDGNDRISFLVENRLTPFKVKEIMVQIDRRAFWLRTFEAAGNYLNTFFSDRALNQEAGASYTLRLLYNITGDAQFLDYYNKKMLRFQLRQVDGVFPEINSICFDDNWWVSGYDGSYLQVSMYWLAMLYKEIPEDSVLRMLNSSINFMAYLYFPEGQWEAGFSTRTAVSSPFDEGMAPLYMIPYLAMSQKNGYAARIAEIYYERIYFNNLSSSPDWYRLLLNPVAWVDLYDSLVPNPNPEGYRLPIENIGWYLKDFSKIGILVAKTPKYAAFLSYGNTTGTNVLADFYEIADGKHLISGRGDIYSPWGFGVISLNHKYYNTYETQPTLTILNSSTEGYVVKTVGYLKTPTFTAAPVSFEMTYNFANDTAILSTNLNTEEDVYVDNLILGTTPINPSQLSLLLVHQGLLVQNVSLQNKAEEQVLEYNDVESVFFNDFSLRSDNPSKSLTVLDLSNNTVSPYGYVEFVGWNLAEKGTYLDRGSSIDFTSILAFESIGNIEETYTDEIKNYLNFLQGLVAVLAITNIITGVLLVILSVSRVKRALRQHDSKLRNLTEQK